MCICTTDRSPNMEYNSKIKKKLKTINRVACYACQMRVFTAPMRSNRFQQSAVSIFLFHIYIYLLFQLMLANFYFIAVTQIYIEYTQSLKLELANKTHAMQTQRR